MNLMTIDTPALILDEAKMDANIARMRDKATSLGGLQPYQRLKKLKNLPLTGLRI